MTQAERIKKQFIVIFLVILIIILGIIFIPDFIKSISNKENNESKSPTENRPIDDKVLAPTHYMCLISSDSTNEATLGNYYTFDYEDKVINSKKETIAVYKTKEAFLGSKDQSKFPSGGEPTDMNWDEKTLTMTLSWDFKLNGVDSSLEINRYLKELEKIGYKCEIAQ